MFRHRRQLTLSWARGEVRPLVGENGAGNSTLIKIMTGGHGSVGSTL
jgi:ABC-type sugar transport system ATPase subunit